MQRDLKVSYINLRLLKMDLHQKGFQKGKGTTPLSGGLFYEKSP